MAYTFKGGIHVDEHKLTDGCPIEKLPEPDYVKLSMSQNIGAPCIPAVAVGDHVCVGTVVGAVPEGALGCPVHSSVSGTVRAIEDNLMPTGAKESTVIIDNDGEGTVADTVTPFEKNINDATREEITDIIKNAGISGMGGAAFPTYAKINSAVGKAKLLIVNCAECEPFITSDHRLLLERPEEVIAGIKILMKATGVPEAYIGVEDNKRDAVPMLKKLTKDADFISVKVVKTKYPQGDERQLIYALTGRELPQGKLPADAGCVIFNAATCAAAYNAFKSGMPLVKRIVTVSGDCVKEPKNVEAPIGTPASVLVEYCGGLVKSPEKIITGGPMMGQTQWDANVPVKKGTSSILLLSADYSKKPSLPATCIRCGKCIRNCPQHLMPSYIAQFVQHDDMEGAEKYGAMNCVECGSCSYNCPGKVEIVQYIRVAKASIRAAAAQMKAAKEKSEKN